MSEAREGIERIIKLINKTPKAKQVFESEDWSYTIQFNLDGENDPFYLVIKNGIGKVIIGEDPNADMVIIGDNNSIVKTSQGRGDFTHGISREEITVEKGKVFELMRVSRAIGVALKEQKKK
jgi:putative sterol carrier protein